MALVDDYQVKEVARELLVDVLLLLAPRHRLVERQVDLEGLVDGAIDDLGHSLSEGLEVVGQRLIEQDVTVGEEEHTLHRARLPKAPDDLERGVGLAGAGGHHQQHPALPMGDGLDGALDGDPLVVARLLAAAVVVVREADNSLYLIGDAFPRPVAAPQLAGARELIEAEGPLYRIGEPGAVVEQETIAVRGEGEGDIEGFSVAEGLRQSAADRVRVVLRLDHRQRKARSVEKQVVGPLLLAPHRDLAAHQHLAGGEEILPPHLGELVPASRVNRGGDVLIADLCFVESLLGHRRSAAYRREAVGSRWRGNRDDLADPAPCAPVTFR